MKPVHFFMAILFQSCTFSKSLTYNIGKSERALQSRHQCTGHNSRYYKRRQAFQEIPNPYGIMCRWFSSNPLFVPLTLPICQGQAEYDTPFETSWLLASSINTSIILVRVLSSYVYPFMIRKWKMITGKCTCETPPPLTWCNH